jgi:uncharacterized membrane protein
MTAPGSREIFKPERLLAFTDGVFGVAITLLVIDLRLPPNSTSGGDAGLLQALLAMEPKVYVFAFTFIIVGLSWLAHHRRFSYIDKVDSALLWLNLFFLMALCLVPFASSVLSEYSSRFAFVLYSAVMALVCLLSACMSVYGLRTPFLATSDLTPSLWQDMALAPLLTGIIFVIAAGMALGGLVRMANWSLGAILPVMAFFGHRSRRAVRPSKHVGEKGELAAPQ